MFKIIFSDHEIDNREKELVYKYAVKLGFSSSNVQKVIDRSIAMFKGEFDFEDYVLFVKK